MRAETRQLEYIVSSLLHSEGASQVVITLRAQPSVPCFASKPVDLRVSNVHKTDFAAVIGELAVPWPPFARRLGTVNDSNGR